MATMNEVMERVKRTKPNAIDEKDQARWLLQLDGRVYNEVTGQDEDVQPAKSWPDDGDKELLAQSPYDGIYDLYLTAMICFALGEYSDYNNAAELFDQEFQAFRAWWRRGHVPQNTVPIKGV